MSINKEHRGAAFGGAPNGAAAFSDRPIGSVFLNILYHKYLWIFLIHSLYIPYIFPGYVPCIFHILSTCCPHFAPCSTFCPHVVFIFSTFWKLREVYMLKNTSHDSLFKKALTLGNVSFRNPRYIIVHILEAPDAWEIGMRNQ